MSLFLRDNDYFTGTQIVPGCCAGEMEKRYYAVEIERIANEIVEKNHSFSNLCSHFWCVLSDCNQSEQLEHQTVPVSHQNANVPGYGYESEWENNSRRKETIGKAEGETSLKSGQGGRSRQVIVCLIDLVNAENEWWPRGVSPRRGTEV